MLKDTTFKDKFAMLTPWMPMIMECVKKDLKNDHLSRDLTFVRHYFAGKNVNKLTVEELAEAYSHNLSEGEKTEELGDYICNRWLLKNTDIYNYFDQALSQINNDFQNLDLLERSVALTLMEKSIQEFGAPKTYLFCVLNSVVFPEDVYQILAKKAEQTHKQHVEDTKVHQENASVEAMQKNYEQQISRLTDKYEKKLQGLQKKYTIDVEALKKQVANLQRKLNA